jgi:carbonic anhydrase
MRFASLALCLALISGSVAQHSPENSVKPTKALEFLKSGNKRFAVGKSKHPNASAVRRQEVAGGQHPFAIIVACSDSRVSPELVFDQGLGDLFVVRCAGNTVDEVAAGSIEYAVEHLGARLIYVMGHEKCGAVHAAVQGGKLPGSIGAVVKPIMPAVAEAKKHGGDLDHETAIANVLNVEHTMGKIDTLMGEMLDKHQVEVAGGIYDLKTGVVTQLK